MSDHIDCNHVRSQLVDLFGNELDAESRRAIETHAATCADCAREIADWSEVHGVLHRVANPAASITVKPAASTPTRLPFGTWRLAAGIAIVFSAGLLAGRSLSSPASPVIVAQSNTGSPTLIDRYREVATSSPGAGSLGHALLSMAKR